MANHVSFNISATEEVDFQSAFKMHTYTRKYQDRSWKVIEPLELENQDFMQEAEPKFDDEGQVQDWIRFLKWLQDSSDLNSDGSRLAEFIRNVI